MEREKHPSQHEQQHQRRQKSPSSSTHQQDEDQQQQQQQQPHGNSDETSPSPGHLSWSPSPTDSLVSGNERREIGDSRRRSPVPSPGMGSSVLGSGLRLSSVSSPSSRLGHQPQASVPGELDGTDLHEAEAAAARAAEAKARLAEAKVRSELAAREAKEASEAAEVAREASTAVVVPLPATREDMTQDGRVGRRENAFLDTYFAFFGRFARLETESEARRTLIELSLLQDASPGAVRGSRFRRAGSGGNRDEGSAADENSSGAAGGGRVEAGGGGNNNGDAGGDSRGSSALRGGNSTCIRRGVTPEKGASLWAGVGIGAMLQVRRVIVCEINIKQEGGITCLFFVGNFCRIGLVRMPLHCNFVAVELLSPGEVFCTRPVRWRLIHTSLSYI